MLRDLDFLITVFLGAFLLFLVQPLAAKQILPWFGGGSSVWSACLLFFQIALVAGYAYAHYGRRFSERARIRWHLVLLLVATAMLPIVASPAWKPPDGERLVPRVLGLLSATVGVPYVVLAATAPMLQDWYARLRPGQSPYWLYVLSNAGSLAALAAYPLVVEPFLTTRVQAMWWSAGFVGFAALSAWCAWRIRRRRQVPANAGTTDAVPPPGADPAPSFSHQLQWLLLPACGTGLLLATTNALTQDVASVPLLWVVPLAVYLLTYIVAFGGVYSRTIWTVVFLVALGGYWFMYLGQPVPPVRTQAAVFLVALAAGCMVCHGELVRLRPAVAHLTEFYLALAIGGSFGGFFVAVAAPLLFTSYVELPLLYLLTGSLLTYAIASAAARRWAPRYTRLGVALAVALLLAMGARILQSQRLSRNAVAAGRSFYGVLRVVDDSPQSTNRMRRLFHGRILHGGQFLKESSRSRATTYYGEGTGIDLAIRRHPARASGGTLKIGMVGLGTGTAAALAMPGDRFRFFEIDPLVIDFASTYFTYLRDARARTRVEVVTGDARLSLERELTLEQNVHSYDVLAVDAFSGDAIPVHLLTREAFALYDQAIRPDGILAIHVSNRFLDLKPVVQASAVERGFKLLQVVTSSNATTGAIASTWLLATRNQPFFETLSGSAVPPPASPRLVLWTDDFSSLLQILR